MHSHAMCAAIPSTPSQPVVIEKSKIGSIELKWSHVSDESLVVLYIVDQRWTVGRHWINGTSTDWQQIVQVSAGFGVC